MKVFTFCRPGCLATLLLSLTTAFQVSADTTTLIDVSAPQLLVQQADGLKQFLFIRMVHEGAPYSLTVTTDSGVSESRTVEPGEQLVEIAIPQVAQATNVHVDVSVDGKPLGYRDIVVNPVRAWTVYLLPHSHVDIGYTKVQTEVEADQQRFLDIAIEAARATDGNKDGSAFRWNTEVMWALDAYLRNATPDKRAEFVDAVKKGWVGVDALYGNELTALCRPEELVRLTSCANRVRDELGITIDTAMISDVPGYTWGLMMVLAQSGVKYFSMGPNRGDRVGHMPAAWGDKPFYWVSPSGQEKVLCWVAGQGYSWFHGKPGDVRTKLIGYLADLNASQYPYDLVQVRYNTGGDNGPPDPGISDYVREWNATYVAPKLAISTAHTMFTELEYRYGATIPTFSGDMTPYWEDGAASTSRETGINRASAERLVQAETLWALLNPSTYPMQRFRDAWRNVLLYSEHTWGAHNSISEPDSDFVKSQWAIKQSFALDADQQSKALLDEALSTVRATGATQSFAVFNTSSWTRTGLVRIAADASAAGNRVVDDTGAAIPSQRLTTGELVFVARDVPALGARTYRVEAGDALIAGSAYVEGNRIGNALIFATVEPRNGAIAVIRSFRREENLVDRDAGYWANEYLNVPGTDSKDARRSGSATIRVVENGPVFASLAIDSYAPGCISLHRELWVVDGMEQIEIINTLDKTDVRSKEGIHFAYPFRVPEGQLRMDLAWSVIRPEFDQLPGSCKNWFTVQRWVDISNQGFGVTWMPLDAPLIEIGGVTAESPWMKTIAPSQLLFSYVMNNYWHTNYKASQPGVTTFRYAVAAHGMFDLGSVQRRATEYSQPLQVVPVAASSTIGASKISLDAPGVVVTTIKRSEDGKATIVRLFGAAGRPERVSLTELRALGSVSMTDFSERPGVTLVDGVDVPAFGVVTLRLEF